MGQGGNVLRKRKNVMHLRDVRSELGKRTERPINICAGKNRAPRRGTSKLWADSAAALKRESTEKRDH